MKSFATLKTSKNPRFHNDTGTYLLLANTNDTRFQIHCLLILDVLLTHDYTTHIMFIFFFTILLNCS